MPAYPGRAYRVPARPSPRPYRPETRAGAQSPKPANDNSPPSVPIGRIPAGNVKFDVLGGVGELLRGGVGVLRYVRQEFEYWGGQLGPQPGGFNLTEAGWTKVCSTSVGCPPGPSPTNGQRWVNTRATSCIIVANPCESRATGPLTNSGDQTYGQVLPPQARTLYLFREEYIGFGIWRRSFSEQWVSPNVTTPEIPVYSEPSPGRHVFLEPIIEPWWNPSIGEEPVNWPKPQELPWPSAVPENDPDPEPEGRPSRRVILMPPVVQPGIGTDPWFGPGVTINPPPVGRPNTPPQVEVTPPTRPTQPPKPQPPRRDTKERKTTIRSVAGPLWVVINSTTEAFDFVDAMHKALPRDKRRSCRNAGEPGRLVTIKRKKDGVIKTKKHCEEMRPQDQLVDIYNHFDVLDLEKAFNNYVNMQIGDYVAAIVDGKRLNQLTGAATGGDRALNIGEKYAQELGGGMKPPTVDIDFDTGEVTLTFYDYSTVFRLRR